MLQWHFLFQTMFQKLWKKSSKNVGYNDPLVWPNTGPHSWSDHPHWPQLIDPTNLFQAIRRCHAQNPQQPWFSTIGWEPQAMGIPNVADSFWNGWYGLMGAF